MCEHNHMYAVRLTNDISQRCDIVQDALREIKRDIARRPTNRTTEQGVSNIWFSNRTLRCYTKTRFGFGIAQQHQRRIFTAST